MSLFGGIQSLLAADEAITSLIPAASIFTGRVPPGALMPYARLDVPAAASGGRSSATDFEIATIRINVWTDTAAEGQAIARAIQGCLANQSFDSDDDRVLDLRGDGLFSEQQEEPEDKSWRHVIQFSARLASPRTH